MTQDTGQANPMDSSFWRTATHIVAGAAAGIGARDGGQAMRNGVYVGTALQNSYLKEKEFEYNRAAREKYDAQREESMELDNKLKKQRLELYENKQKDDDFLGELKAINSMMGSQVMRNRQESFRRITASHPGAQEGLFYPLDEKEAEKIESVTKYSETMANVDAYMLATEHYLTKGGKQAELMHKALGAKLGLSIKTLDNGEKVVLTPFGTFPANYQNASKLKKMFHDKKLAEEQLLIQMRRTRHTAASGAQSYLLKHMSDLNLDSKDKLLIAQQYSKEIAGKPHMARTMDFAHTANRLIKSKDKEFSETEKAELVTKLKKANVNFHRSNKGEYYIDGKSFNEYVNRFNNGEPIKVMSDSMQKVDENLVSQMYGRAGIDNLAQNLLKEAEGYSEKRTQDQASQLQSELSKYAQKKRIDAQADIEADLLKEQAVTQKRTKDIVSGKWSKSSPEEIMETLKFNTTEREAYHKQLASEMSRRFSDKKGYMNTLKKEYQELTGSPLDLENINSTAMATIKQLPVFEKMFSSKQEDNIGKMILKRLTRDRTQNRVTDVNRRLDANYKALESERILKKNAESKLKKASVLDSILDDGEE
jgi:hypothetical protein